MDFHRQQCTPGLSRLEPQWSRTKPRTAGAKPPPALTHHGMLSKSFNQPELDFSHL